MLGSFGSVVALANLSNNLNQTLASGERVLSLLEEEPLVEEVLPTAKVGELDVLAGNGRSMHGFTGAKADKAEVGELGDTLSGGEKQRIGLARAFLHNAPFMLLDEPTSNLDSMNEAVILKSLYEAKEDKTVLIVSHRESTLRIADVTYQMESGRVS